MLPTFFCYNIIMKAKGTKIFFGIIIFFVFIFLFSKTVIDEKDKTLCGEKGILTNFNLIGIVPKDFCNKSVTENNLKNISFASSTVLVEEKSKPEEMMLGLSGRENLPAGYGMLFVFNDIGSHGFWMKDMNFPIDIIFIDDNFLVTGIEKEIATNTYPEIFGEDFVSKYVLEVNAGFADANGIKIGDKVNLGE